jgi:hypothetical protein
MVGAVPKTALPVPVLVVSAASRFALDGVASQEAMPVPRPEMPAMGRPVALVSVPDAGVPSAPALTTTEPAVPTFTPSAVATPVPGVVVASAPNATPFALVQVMTLVPVLIVQSPVMRPST